MKRSTILALGFLVSLVFAFAEQPVVAQVDTAWVRTYDGPGNGPDEPWALAVDSSGNVYVAGRSYDSETIYDYGTIKYYPNGDTAWIRTYDGPGEPISEQDEAFALAVDDAGNVYVTGYSYGMEYDIDTYADLATIKYYPNGDTAWVRRFNGPGYWEDCANAIAVDVFGNVCVTGTAFSDETDYDFVTTKYFPNGDTAWVRWYDGGDQGTWDTGNAITTDDSGNIYVTGRGGGLLDEFDYVTIKYYPNGVVAWGKTYRGPGYEDFPYAIAVDDPGNVYVTGESDGTGTGKDYATIKYNPNGDTAWVRRYNGPGNHHDIPSVAYSLAVDDSGNAYVTGTSYGAFTTIKYNPDGDEIWVERFFAPGSSGGEARALAVSDSGNIYVTGISIYGLGNDWSTVKFSQGPSACAYLAGDANMYNETVDLGNPLSGPWRVGGDVTFLVNYFDISSGNQPCLMYNPKAPDEGQINNHYFFASADATGDCQVLGGDVSRLVQYFAGNQAGVIRWCGWDKPDPENYYQPLWLSNRGSGGEQPVPPLEELPPSWPNCETVGARR